MKTKYCTVCGKKLEFHIELYDKKFDADTGEPIFHKITIYKCPDWVDGYSNRYYTFHDKISETEQVKEIPDNAQFFEYRIFTG